MLIDMDPYIEKLLTRERALTYALLKQQQLSLSTLLLMFGDTAGKWIFLLREQSTLRSILFEAIDKVTCEGAEGPCESTEVELVLAQTQYEWDGVGMNPNRPHLFCTDCKNSYNKEWADRWSDYYASVI